MNAQLKLNREAHLNLLQAVSFRIVTNGAQDFDSRCLLRAIGQRQSHFTMGERVGRVRTEGQLGTEHSLTLQSSTLSDEQMIVIAL